MSAIIVMGVSGAGKTTAGRLLADALGTIFIDGDDLHLDDARAKMASGGALTDADRTPWLDRVAAALNERATPGGGAVVACSALRRIYRDRLRAGVGPALRFVYLKADPALARLRVGERKDHYMPASLVGSQFAALEPPDDEPDVVTLSADCNLAQSISDLVVRLAMRGSAND